MKKTLTIKFEITKDEVSTRLESKNIKKMEIIGLLEFAKHAVLHKDETDTTKTD